MNVFRNLKKFLRPSCASNRVARRRSVRLDLECLERRDTPTVTYSGGALMPHVEVQPMFYGLDWALNSALLGQAIQLSGFMGNIVNSSYMDMLNKAGYAVGRGTASAGDLYSVNIDKTQFLNDTQIQNSIAHEIENGQLQTPDTNRLYMVFVEPNVAIQLGLQNSVNDFLGYHGAFECRYYVSNGWSGYWADFDVRYAVIAYPGGSVPLTTGSVANAGRSWLNAFDTMTLSASHELAEAVTDPDVNYSTLGWNDSVLGEIGDVNNAQTVYLNGYAVQRISDQNDQAMTPMGATSANPVDFVLKSDGTFWVRDASGFNLISSDVASISDQGVDNFGQAMVDVVYTNGSAAEYHEGTGWVYLRASGVKQAKADQGESYVLMTNGNLYRFKDWPGSFVLVDSNVQSIDAGTDQYGVNMVTEVKNDSYYRYVYVNGFWMMTRYTSSDGFEFSDTTGRHFIASNVRSMSAGQQGFMGYITTGGDAYLYNESSVSSSYLGSGVTAMTVGTDQSGNYMIDLLFSDGSLWELHQGSIWMVSLANGVASIGKAHAGVEDIVFSWGDAWTHSANGWTYLTGNAKTAA